MAAIEKAFLRQVGDEYILKIRLCVFLMFILFTACMSSAEAVGAASNVQALSNDSSSNQAVYDSSTLDHEKNGVDVSKQNLIVYTTPDKYTNEDFLNDISIWKHNQNVVYAAIYNLKYDHQLPHRP